MVMAKKLYKSDGDEKAHLIYIQIRIRISVDCLLFLLFPFYKC